MCDVNPGRMRTFARVGNKSDVYVGDEPMSAKDKFCTSMQQEAEARA